MRIFSGHIEKASLVLLVMISAHFTTFYTGFYGDLLHYLYLYTVILKTYTFIGKSKTDEDIKKYK